MNKKNTHLYELNSAIRIHHNRFEIDKYNYWIDMFGFRGVKFLALETHS